MLLTSLLVAKWELLLPQFVYELVMFVEKEVSCKNKSYKYLFFKTLAKVEKSFWAYISLVICYFKKKIIQIPQP